MFCEVLNILINLQSSGAYYIMKNIRAGRNPGP